MIDKYLEYFNEYLVDIDRTYDDVSDEEVDTFIESFYFDLIIYSIYEDVKNEIKERRS